MVSMDSYVVTDCLTKRLYVSVKKDLKVVGSMSSMSRTRQIHWPFTVHVIQVHLRNVCQNVSAKQLKDKATMNKCP